MSARCEILQPTQPNLQRCARKLQAGDVIGLPTETVYGLAGNALCEKTVRKIFSVKGRPLIDPLIVHFPSLERAAQHAEFSDLAGEIAARFWPGALTLVLPKRESIPDIVTAGLPSVAIRVPAHPVFRSVLEQLNFPLAAPSANPFGYVSPTRAEHVREHLGDRISAVLDGGPCRHGVESTILDLRDPKMPRVLRPGPISHHDLGIDFPDTLEKTDDRQSQAAPGMLTQHYSPDTPIELFTHGEQPAAADSAAAVLYNTKPSDREPTANQFWLSEDGDAGAIAHNLFTLIRKLDAGGYRKLHVELAEEAGVGVAVNDRLRRAAAKRTH